MPASMQKLIIFNIKRNLLSNICKAFVVPLISVKSVIIPEILKNLYNCDASVSRIPMDSGRGRPATFNERVHFSIETVVNDLCADEINAAAMVA